VAGVLRSRKTKVEGYSLISSNPTRGEIPCKTLIKRIIISSEKSKEEVRDEFLANIKNISFYWANQKNTTDKEKCEGVAFSILTLIDGCSNMPSIDLMLQPHEKDKEYCISNDENYYKSGMVINDDVYLHELL